MKMVSFILPAYKRRFLKEAIDSILAQTCREFELVVVDDKSPEDLYGVIEEYPWEKCCELLPDGGKKWLVDGIAVRYYQNEVNIGEKSLVDAWAKAIDYALNDWIVLAGDDDVYAPMFLEKMLELQGKYPSVDIVHCRSRIIDGTGSIIDISSPKAEYESAVELVYERLVKGYSQFVPEFMFRRSRFKEIGGFVKFPKAWYSDDATWPIMAEKGCANCNEPLFSFRYSGCNISTSYDKIADLVKAGLQYLSFAKESFPRLRPTDDLERFMLEKVMSVVANRVKGLIVEEMSNTGFMEWWTVMLSAKMPLAWKLSCVKQTVKRRLLRR